ncbi:MAG: hypothetical protein OSA93_17290 [Akkermansiaceae bacterium]|jgi:hypothetical protein|nr:hypothetical protein [Akkermansiaceae bacterium]
MGDSQYWKTFPLVTGKKMVTRLGKAVIEFEIEFDDSGIKKMSPAEARWGQFGLEVKLIIYLHGADVRKAEKLAAKP